MQVLTIEQRREILNRQVAAYSRVGYRVVSQTDTSAQLVKPKSFSCLWASLWFLFFGIGLLFYLFYYWGKSETTLYIAIDEYGRLRKA